MNSNNAIRNYKHDISGKFNDIKSAINSLDEKSFEDSDNNEIFHAVHEVLLKMVKTSRNTILENLKQDIVLVVSDKEPDLTLSKLQIEGVTVRYEIKNKKMTYFLFTLENKGEVKENVAKIVCLLPVKTIVSGLKSDLIEESIYEY